MDLLSIITDLSSNHEKRNLYSVNLELKELIYNSNLTRVIDEIFDDSVIIDLKNNGNISSDSNSIEYRRWDLFETKTCHLKGYEFTLFNYISSKNGQNIKGVFQRLKNGYNRVSFDYSLYHCSINVDGLIYYFKLKVTSLSAIKNFYSLDNHIYFDITPISQEHDAGALSLYKINIETLINDLEKWDNETNYIVKAVQVLFIYYDNVSHPNHRVQYEDNPTHITIDEYYDFSDCYSYQCQFVDHNTLILKYEFVVIIIDINTGQIKDRISDKMKSYNGARINNIRFMTLNETKNILYLNGINVDNDFTATFFLIAYDIRRGEIISYNIIKKDYKYFKLVNNNIIAIIEYNTPILNKLMIDYIILDHLYNIVKSKNICKIEYRYKSSGDKFNFEIHDEYLTFSNKYYELSNGEEITYWATEILHIPEL